MPKPYHRADTVLNTGEIIIVGRIYKDDVLPATEEQRVNGALAAHGETVFCLEKHDHSKACAVALIDLKDKDADGKDIDGTSVREKIQKWVDEWDADPTPAVPEHVEMPQKEIEVVENGKRVKRQVDDRDLA